MTKITPLIFPRGHTQGSEEPTNLIHQPEQLLISPARHRLAPPCSPRPPLSPGVDEGLWMGPQLREGNPTAGQSEYLPPAERVFFCCPVRISSAQGNQHTKLVHLDINSLG